MKEELLNGIIRRFDQLADTPQVIALWRQVLNYSSPHNAPQLAIDKKVAAGDGLFFVAETGGKVVGTIMAGYDGHRGWLYSLAVQPEYRKQSIGSRLVKHAEKRLIELGCPKINLQIMKGNEQVEAFYRKLGYETEPRISMGKKIISNVQADNWTARPPGTP